MTEIDTNQLTAVAGGAMYQDRVSAISDHDQMIGRRLGNRLGDRMGLANNFRGDNRAGDVASFALGFGGLAHGVVSAAAHPSKGNDLYARWGYAGEVFHGPRR